MSKKESKEESLVTIFLKSFPQYKGKLTGQHVKELGGKLKKLKLLAQEASEVDSSIDSNLYYQQLLTADQNLQDFLLKNAKDDLVKTCNRTAVGNVLAVSRPFEEWDIYKLSAEVQRVVYSLSHSNEYLIAPTDKAGHHDWMNHFDIVSDYYNTQGFNLILKNAINTYKGVEVKASNSYNKKCEKINKKNEFLKSQGRPLLALPVAPDIYDSVGCLVNPPGINNTIFGYQSSKLRLLSEKDVSSLRGDIKYNQYTSTESKINIQYIIGQRMKLDSSQKGFIRNKDKVSLFKKDSTEFLSKRRKIKNNADGAIRMIATFGDDWVIFDARGMLRSVYYYGLAKPGTLKVENLLSFFKSDISIFPWKNEIKISFKEDSIKIPKKNVIKCGKKVADKIIEMCESEAQSILSIDLGATNPVAWRLSTLDSNAKPTFVSQGALKMEGHLEKLHEKLNQLEEDLDQKALDSLSPEEKNEFILARDSSAEKTKNELVSKFGLPDTIDFDSMSSNTTYISKYLNSIGASDNEVYYPSTNGDKRFIYDSSFASNNRPKVSNETRQKLQEAKWNLQRSDERYQKHSTYQKEMIRSLVNSLVKESSKTTSANVIVAIEDLNVKFFNGKGAREKGWDAFFSRKKENRWFMKAFHKALTELAAFKGVMVIEVNPSFTSQRCVKCFHIDKGNRSGEHFKCLKCGHYANADIEIATSNIEMIALSGEKIVGPIVKKTPSAKRKSPSGAQKAGVARKTVST